MISFVICSIDAAKFTAIQQNIAQRLGAEPYEIVGVHDAKSLCDGYNRGVQRARGKTIIFCHDDIEILSPDFVPKLKRAMSQFDLVGVAGTDRVIGGLWSIAGPPHLFGQIAHLHAPTGNIDVSLFSTPRRIIGNIHALDGVFMAARREVAKQIRFDEQLFDGWHLYDMDFSFAAHLAGFRIGVSCEINILHTSIGSADQLWMKYAQLFNRKYLAHLYPMPQPVFVVCQIRVATRQDALEVMTPRFWDEPAVS